MKSIMWRHVKKDSKNIHVKQKRRIMYKLVKYKGEWSVTIGCKQYVSKELRPLLDAIEIYESESMSCWSEHFGGERVSVKIVGEL